MTDSKAKTHIPQGSPSSTLTGQRPPHKFNYPFSEAVAPRPQVSTFRTHNPCPTTICETPGGMARPSQRAQPRPTFSPFPRSSEGGKNCWCTGRTFSLCVRAGGNRSKFSRFVKLSRNHFGSTRLGNKLQNERQHSTELIKFSRTHFGSTTIITP